jgi:hypothetical protein
MDRLAKACGQPGRSRATTIDPNGMTGAGGVRHGG